MAGVRNLHGTGGSLVVWGGGVGWFFWGVLGVVGVGCFELGLGCAAVCVGLHALSGERTIRCARGGVCGVGGGVGRGWGFLRGCVCAGMVAWGASSVGWWGCGGWGRVVDGGTVVASILARVGGVVFFIGFGGCGGVGLMERMRCDEVGTW